MLTNTQLSQLISSLKMTANDFYLSMAIAGSLMGFSLMFLTLFILTQKKY